MGFGSLYDYFLGIAHSKVLLFQCLDQMGAKLVNLKLYLERLSYFNKGRLKQSSQPKVNEFFSIVLTFHNVNKVVASPPAKGLSENGNKADGCINSP